MDLTKFSVFLLPQITFCIPTATICLPYNFPIIFEFHTEMLGASAQFFLMLLAGNHPSSPLPCGRLPPLPWIIEILKWNKMQFYFVLKPKFWRLGNIHIHSYQWSKHHHVLLLWKVCTVVKSDALIWRRILGRSWWLYRHSLWVHFHFVSHNYLSFSLQYFVPEQLPPDSP